MLQIPYGNRYHFPVPVFDFSAFQHYEIVKWQIDSFRIFTFFMIKCPIFKLSTFPTCKFQSVKLRFSDSTSFKISFLNIQNSKCRYFKNLGTRTFQHLQNFRFSDMKNMFQGCSHHVSCIRLKYFGDKYGLRGSRFSRLFS